MLDNSGTISLHTRLEAIISTDTKQAQQVRRQINENTLSCLLIPCVHVGGHTWTIPRNRRVHGFTEGVLGVLEPSGLPLLLPLGVGVILFFLGSYLLISTLRDNSLRKKVVAVVGSHKQITFDEIGRQSGVKLPKTRSLIYDAIRREELSGTIKENTFVRTEYRPGEKVTIEKEAMVSRKVPENCFKCGASVNPQEVEWVGLDQVRCPHCGATMAVSTERL